MNKIDYTIELLKRLSQMELNDKPYVSIEDVEFILRNGDVLEEQTKTKYIQGTIMDVLDRRPGTWPDYYDECDAQEYYEWFIKGTNIKLGFDYIDGKTNEHHWYKIVCDGYDQMEPYDTEEEFLEDIEWMLNNIELTWRYYE